MRRSIIACGLLLACAGISAAAAAGSGDRAAAVQARAQRHAVVYWTRHIRRFRTGTRRWLTVIRGRPPVGRSRTLSAHSPQHLRQLAHLWHRREHSAWRRATHPPDFHAWLCIHHYEGSWQDSGGPYYGGLQMDLSFQETYGRWLLQTKGTADHWSPLEQIWVAVHAWRVRGFSPWPNTARYCGVL